MLDHMTGGRANAGFARGYQRRWVDMMAQQTHGIHGALPHQHDEIDAANRAAFEENFRIIKKCWTEEMLDLPRQVLEGAGRRDAVDAGDHGEVRQGRRERHPASSVGVVPKPLQKPHPPICSSRSPRPRTRSAGARSEGRDGRSCRRCCPIYEDKLYERLRRGVGPAARPGHRRAARRHHRRHRRGGDGAVGAIPASSPAMPGSSRSASAAACRIPRPARFPTPEEAIGRAMR